MRLFAFASVLIAGVAHADPAAPTVDPSIGKVEITLDLPKDKPYVGEMIMLRMRSFIRADIVLDDVIQPELTNFDWQQLGRDKPIEAMVDGFEVSGIERDLAIFPQQSGRLIIEPFTRRVTVVNSDNVRLSADFTSKRVYVDVQNNAALAPEGSWWLPAKSLSVTDNWSSEPDEIKPGTLSRRTITIEAVGLTADRLPPAPEMLAPGTIAFKGPAQRETIITEDGPVARATYIWDIRPVSVSPARLPAVSIPWFDTSERRPRQAALAETWVAYVGTLVHPSHEKAKTARDLYLSGGSILACALGFVWTAALAGVLVTRRPRLRERRLDVLVRRARFGDEAGFRNTLADLARHAPLRWRQVAAMPLVAARLAAFDAARYGRVGGEIPPLVPLAADLASLWPTGEASAVDALPPLDGTLPAPASWLRTTWLRTTWLRTSWRRVSPSDGRSPRH